MAQLVRSISQDYLNAGLSGVVSAVIGGLGSAPTGQDNQAVLDSLVPGDLIRIARDSMYSHWAVYIGNKEVIHYNNTSNITQEDFWKVVGSDKAYKANKHDVELKPFSPDDVVTRAKYRLGFGRNYDVVKSNCEHFANWCRYNKWISGQAENAAFIAKAGTVVLGGAGPLSLAATAVVGQCMSQDKNIAQEEEARIVPMRKGQKIKKCCLCCCCFRRGSSK